MVFAPWPVDESLFVVGAIYSYLRQALPEKVEGNTTLTAAMALLTWLYVCRYVIPGFLRGARVMTSYLFKERQTTPFFSWKCYYCLCASESATTVVCAAMFYDAGWLGPLGAVLLASLGNMAGYAKYLVQMWYDHDYVATSIFLYVLMYVALAVCQRDPMYYILMVYPFKVLLKVPSYANMKGRKILFDEASIILHSCDHLIHGTITCCVGIYHFLGFKAVLIAHLFVVPLGYFISDGTTRIQQRLSESSAEK
eukprot:TRINITY_DN54746_c0_g1_i1.p1 TRINITY_DN54746_c0_g1~~TRINITY_DN54746_c0_g1_i1.p1  ORF type:complete len:253 (-),score=37.53 TRINITY_DN54746_c0_g1_i1:60-818(-)